MYFIPDDPLLEWLTACWKFTKKEPAHAVYIFNAIIKELAAEVADDVSIESYENDNTSDKSHVDEDDVDSPDDIPTPSGYKSSMKSPSLSLDGFLLLFF